MTANIQIISVGMPVTLPKIRDFDEKLGSKQRTNHQLVHKHILLFMSSDYKHCLSARRGHLMDNSSSYNG
jgi:hypothetical protein